MGGTNHGAACLARDRVGERVSHERHSLADAGDDARLRNPRGDRLVDDLGHEHRAVLAEGDAAVGLDGDFAQLDHVGDALELAPLLGDKRAGTGAASLVHGRVADPAAVEANVLGVLAADLEDRVDLLVEVERAWE